MATELVRANPFRRQWAATGSAVLEATRRVGESGWYILGEEVEALERELSVLQQRKHAVGCASGLDAIEIGLRALGIEYGDRVLTTPFSAFATTLAIVRAGGVPVFVDVDDTGLIDLDRAADCLAENGDIRYLVPVHLFGHSLDLQALEALKEHFNLHVVEDCAQAIGARSRGRPVGDVGEVATFSFYPTKNLGALGDGGALTMDDDGLFAKCRVVRDYGQRGKYRHEEIGLNSRLDELHAAILRTAFLPHLEAWTRRRAEIAECYLSGLNHPLVSAVSTPQASESVWHLFPVRVPATSREAFLDYLQAAGVLAGVHYPKTIPDQPALQRFGQVTVHGGLRRARELASEEVSLPIHPFLHDAEVSRVIELTNRWKP